MREPGIEKDVDKGGVAPYPTPSMSSPLSPDMLIRGAIPVQIWTERGDLTDGCQEEGEEGCEEEEVGAPGNGGVNGSPPSFLPGPVPRSWRLGATRVRLDGREEG